MLVHWMRDAVHRPSKITVHFNQSMLEAVCEVFNESTLDEYLSHCFVYISTGAKKEPKTRLKIHPIEIIQVIHDLDLSDKKIMSKSCILDV